MLPVPFKNPSMNYVNCMFSLCLTSSGDDVTFVYVSELRMSGSVSLQLIEVTDVAEWFCDELMWPAPAVFPAPQTLL